MTTETKVGPKRGDLEPDLVIDVVAAPTTVDLNQVVTWRIRGRMRGATALILDVVPTSVAVDPVDKYKATVTHQWVAPETNTAGLMLLEVRMVWPGGAPQTSPSSGFSQLRISEDLD